MFEKEQGRKLQDLEGKPFLEIVTCPYSRKNFCRKRKDLAVSIEMTDCLLTRNVLLMNGFQLNQVLGESSLCYVKLTKSELEILEGMLLSRGPRSV